MPMHCAVCSALWEEYELDELEFGELNLLLSGQGCLDCIDNEEEEADGQEDTTLINP